MSATQKTTAASALRARFRAASLWLIAGLPLSLSVSAVVSSVTGSYAREVYVPVLSAWAAVLVWLALRVKDCPCPRCKEPFMAPQDFRRADPRRCAHCGLDLNQEG